MQLFTSFMGQEFEKLKEALWEDFLPALLNNTQGDITGHDITRIPIRQAGSALLYPTLSDIKNWTLTTVVTEHLVSALWVQKEFLSGDHIKIQKGG